MEEPQKSIEANTDLAKSHMLGIKHILAVLFALVLICAGVGGGYWYGNDSKQVTVVTQEHSKSSPGPTPESNGPSTHFVESRGYSWPGASYQFITKLGVPASLQAVRAQSDIQDQSNGFAMFGDGTFNNELGWWLLGDPTNSIENGGGTSQISLVDISNAWLNAAGTTDYSNSDTTFNNPLETPAQKQQFMTQLESTTASCSKDPSKGFKTADGNLAVCYTYSYGQPIQQGYNPIVSLLGYGDVDNQPMVLLGFIQVYDHSQDSDTPAQLTQLSNSIQKGDVPQQTAQTQTALMAALKQTTITASANK